jgi:hypothetical protein
LIGKTFNKENKNVNLYTKGDYCVLIVDTDGIGNCPIYSKFKGKGKSIGHQEKGALYIKEDLIIIISNEPKSNPTPIEIFSYMEILKSLCIKENINKIFFPLHFWVRMGHPPSYLKDCVKRVFKDTSIQVIL